MLEETALERLSNPLLERSISKSHVKITLNRILLLRRALHRQTTLEKQLVVVFREDLPAEPCRTFPSPKSRCRRTTDLR